MSHNYSDTEFEEYDDFEDFDDFDDLEDFDDFDDLEDFDIISDPESLPKTVGVLPLRGVVAFPHIIMPLVIGIDRSIRLVNYVLENREYIGLILSKDAELEYPGSEELHTIGVLGRIHRRIPGKDGLMQIIVQGVARFKVTNWVGNDPFLKAEVAYLETVIDPEKDLEFEAMHRQITDLSRQIVQYMPQVPEEAVAFLETTQDPEVLVYTVAANLRLDLDERLQLLEEDNLSVRMRHLLKLMHHELEVLALAQKIQEDTQGELDKVQREFYLRHQLRTIQNELGEGDETSLEIDNYKEKFKEVGLPEEAMAEALRELDRLQKLPPQAAEYGVIKTYLDWLTELPWNTVSDDNLDIKHAREVLDTDHYGLEKVKERILEFLAVRKLRRDRNISDDDIPEQQRAGGSILLFVGPPGVGKTSLGRSIARALGRNFTRMSLGGVRDEAEIRGHRRTYIGAMPGRIIQALKRAGSRNPVFMLDEVDKVGSDWRGDPSSALLEVLDPQQNHAFRDHYLDLDFDLSDVMFIATANSLETIPAPLRDRMEIIQLDGYTELEKIEIATGYLIPRQIRVNGLHPEELQFSQEGIRQIIRDYTRESGVRTLERQIGKVTRKVATKVAIGEVDPEQGLSIDAQQVDKHLGKPLYQFEAAIRTEKAGVATGLAWTPVGGDVLFIEASCMPGKDRLLITGHLGDVMKESAQIALSYVRSNAELYDVTADQFENRDIHLHVPAGATPKDGPSAGVTMTTALVSLLTNRLVRSNVGMTGELSLRGQVLPIGGLKQKVLAAHRNGLTTVILPRQNERDLEDVPEEIRNKIEFVLVEKVEDVIALALEQATTDSPATKS